MLKLHLYALIFLSVIEQIKLESQTKTLDDENSSINFILFSRETDYEEGYNIYTGDESTLYNSLFEPVYPLKVIIHGFQNSCKDNVFTIIRSAFTKSDEEINLLCVDWSHLAKGTYPKAIDSTIPVGLAISRLLDWLVYMTGLSLQDVHLIGHSLGAHVAGIAGDNTEYNVVGRITGLDPAVPLIDLRPEKSLDMTDATFVEIILTSFLSYGHPLVHTNYFINGGITQPNCVSQTLTGGHRQSSYGGELICSHSKAFELFADVINSPKAFPAERCANVNLALSGTCKNEDRIQYFMLNINYTSYGIFSVKT